MDWTSERKPPARQGSSVASAPKLLGDSPESEEDQAMSAIDELESGEPSTGSDQLITDDEVLAFIGAHHLTRSDHDSEHKQPWPGSNPFRGDDFL